jgi:hypothetical protein
MEELGLDGTAAVRWFSHASEARFVVAEVDDQTAAQWDQQLRDAVRRCYIADSLVTRSAAEHQVKQAEVIASRLPDAGSTMAGDFGEILVYIYHAARCLPAKFFGPKKWRLKQDRTKPAPYSDVIHFSLPQWPVATEDDSLVCSEVKTKSTDSGGDPIGDAIADSEKDRISRLAKSLVWLRESALTKDIGALQREQLRRFIDTTEFPPARRYFCAVAVICASLAQAELATVGSRLPTNCALIVVIVPNLKATYTAVFQAARSSLVAEADR